MNKLFNIYCDESRHTSDPSDRYMVIGALACPRETKREVVHRIHLLQARHGARGEFGWSKVSPSKIGFFMELADLFVDEPELRFRCLVADRRRLDHERFNNGDGELGFYKLYYQTLVHWLNPGNTYYVYLDWQQNKNQKRFADLHTILGRKLSGRAKLACLEPVGSHEQALVQIVDLLIGAVGYTWNQRDKSPAKLAFCNHLAERLGKASLLYASCKNGDHKFNIFHFTGRVE